MSIIGALIVFGIAIYAIRKYARRDADDKSPSQGVISPENAKIILIVVFLVGVMARFSRSDSEGVGESNSPNKPAIPSPQEAAKNVDLEFTWRKVGSGSIMEADFVVENGNRFAVKDIRIVCVHTAPSGTLIDRSRKTIYEIIPGDSSASFKKVNMGFLHSQAKTSRCGVEEAVPVINLDF